MTFKLLTIRILSHPLFIGLILTVALLFLIMPDISRYRITVLEKVLIPGTIHSYFSDLDNDQNSEKINVDNTPTLLKIMLFDGEKVISQYNLPSRRISDGYIYTGDYNDDGFQEIFLLTYRGDSILLSIIDPVVQKRFILNERLIYYKDTIKFQIDIPQGEFLGLVDFGDSRNKTLVFSICTGFSLQPRSIFRYDIDTDELITSPLSGVSINYPALYDLDKDSVPEILINTQATGNYHSQIPYTDQSSWLMVLDKNIEYVFDPVEFQGSPSHIMVAGLPGNSEESLVVLHHYFGTDDITSGLYIFDRKGNVMLSKALNLRAPVKYFIASEDGKNSPEFMLLNAEEGTVSVIDNQFIVKEKRKVPILFSGQPQTRADLDQDGKVEYIFQGIELSSLVIFRNDLSDPLEVNFEEDGYPLYSTTLQRGGRRLIYSQFENSGYSYHYERNPLYYLKYPIVLVLYFAISSVIFLIYRILKYRANVQFMTQKKISELQILSLKNQIDPHFTFNILNSIGSLYTKGGDKQDTYGLFVKYTKLLRHTIQNSDKISVTLKQELEFVSNYVELEQSRSESPFTFKISYEDNIDLNRIIPRMLIHSIVENSIKHGIRRVTGGGELIIDIYYESNCHFIKIRDNGPGLEATHKHDDFSTGKGLGIIEELIRLFNKLEGTKISFSLKNLQSDNEIQIGTVALVRIPD